MRKKRVKEVTHTRAYCTCTLWKPERPTWLVGNNKCTAFSFLVAKNVLHNECVEAGGRKERRRTRLWFMWPIIKSFLPICHGRRTQKRAASFMGHHGLSMYSSWCILVLLFCLKALLDFIFSRPQRKVLFPVSDFLDRARIAFSDHHMNERRCCFFSLDFRIYASILSSAFVPVGGFFVPYFRMRVSETSEKEPAGGKTKKLSFVIKIFRFLCDPDLFSPSSSSPYPLLPFFHFL